ncbi:hypothetical protein FGIG_12582 [Fasciola gigantica]|uniref:Uncharacterized protein n=1 Tax=Fasciola gigantica TaxID=46835 RepID=A0A504YRH4_FASGI|nr:hypothetical protein FGIG_12582 [Fasciola gigantica]
MDSCPVHVRNAIDCGTVYASPCHVSAPSLLGLVHSVPHLALVLAVLGPRTRSYLLCHMLCPVRIL